MRKIGLAMLCLGIVGFALVPTLQAHAVTNPQVTTMTVPGQSLTDIIANRAASSWPWFVVRASGIVAGISLCMLMLSGIGSVTGHTFRFLEPLTAWATHRALGIVCAVSVAFHVVTLLFDKFIPFNLIDIFIPWASQYKTLVLFGLPLGSLYLALGILAFYGLIAVVVTSLFWIDSKQLLWKFLHIASYAVMAAVFVHALFLGTDTSDGIGRILWIGGGVLVLVAIIARLRRTGTT